MEEDKENPANYGEEGDSGQKIFTEENKDELHFIHFPQIKITFDELFEEIDQWLQGGK